MEKDKKDTNNLNLVGMDFFQMINQIFAPPFPRVKDPEPVQPRKTEDDKPVKNGAD